MVCLPVRGDSPRALASGFYRQTNHGITISHTLISVHRHRKGLNIVGGGGGGGGQGLEYWRGGGPGGGELIAGWKPTVAPSPPPPPPPPHTHTHTHPPPLPTPMV